VKRRDKSAAAVSARTTEPSVEAMPQPIGPGAPDRDLRAFRESLVRRMSPQSQQRVEILSKVREVYVKCGRDRLLDQMLDSFLELVTSAPSDGFAPGGVFFITGESGAGKSWATRAMLKRHPALQPEEASYGQIIPWVSVSLRGVSTLNLLGHNILKHAGYPIKETVRSVVWNDLAEILSTRRVFLVHIDETQHLVRSTEKDHDRKELSDALKGAMNYERWPISFILSGLPVTTDIVRLDEQYERRSMMLHLPDVSLPGERTLIERIMRQMSQAAALDCERSIATDLPERVAHSVRYRYARICQVTLAAVQKALTAGALELTIDHYAQAFDELCHARGHDHANPFRADHWAHLTPGSFILMDEDHS